MIWTKLRHSRRDSISSFFLCEIVTEILPSWNFNFITDPQPRRLTAPKVTICCIYLNGQPVFPLLISHIHMILSHALYRFSNPNEMVLFALGHALLSVKKIIQPLSATSGIPSQSMVLIFNTLYVDGTSPLKVFSHDRLLF